MSNTVKNTFNLGTDSTDKTCSIFTNAGRALVKKEVLMLGSKEIYAITNADIYKAYAIYLSEKENEEELHRGIKSANFLKACAGSKSTDGTAITVTTKENEIKKTW